MRYTASEIAWAKFGRLDELALVGEEAILATSGIFARFLDRNTGESRTERFDGRDRGDGASRPAGHPVVPVFSLAERRVNPAITVFLYPSMRRISRCAGSQAAHGYLACAFVATDYLVGLASFPNFRAILWHWRTGERATEVDTAVTDPERRTIACSPRSPPHFSLFEPSTGDLSIYRPVVCSKIVRLLPVERLELPPSRRPVSVAWSAEGELLLRDDLGGVWAFDPEEPSTVRSSRLLLAPTENSSKDSTTTTTTTAAAAAAAAVAGETRRSTVLLAAHRAGFLLIGSAGELRATFYRRSSNDCRAVWTVSLPWWPSAVESRAPGETVFLRGEDGLILRMVWSSRDASPRTDLLSMEIAAHSTVFPIGPCDRFAAVLDVRHRLHLLDVHDGKPVSRPLSLDRDGTVIGWDAHPLLPLLSVSTDGGGCLLVDLAAPRSPRICAHLRLQREPLDAVRFSQAGKILGVASLELSRVFLIVGATATPRVAGLLELDVEVVDILLFESPDETIPGDEAPRLLILGASEILLCFCRIAEDVRVTARRSIPLARPYRTIAYEAPGESVQPGEPLRVFGVPRLSRQLRRLTIWANERDPREALRIAEALSSLHRTRGIAVAVIPRRTCLLTWADDGLIVVRDRRETRRVVAVFASHHRSEAGAESATLVGETVVSVGQNGDLVAVRPRLDADFGTGSLLSGPEGAEVAEVAEVPERPGTPNGTEEETWTERRERERGLALEAKESQERDNVCRDLRRLQERLTALLDENERLPADEELPVSRFLLDEEARRRAVSAAEAEREIARRAAKEAETRRNRVASYLRETFLEPLETRPRSIRAVLREFVVDNYPLAAIDPPKAEVARWSEFSSVTRRLLSDMEEGGLGEGPSGRPRKLETIGGLSPRGYLDVLETNVLAESRERAVKIRFNGLFEEIRAAKRRERKSAERNHEMLRRCVERLRDISSTEPSPVEVPVWRAEVGIRFSSSSSSSTSSSASSSIRSLPSRRRSSARKNVAADDELEAFRRETLERTMDGVLEHGSEDEANGVPAKPGFLGVKDSSEYTEEEVRAVARYEDEVRLRRARRERLRGRLEERITLLRGSLRRDALAFDARLEELATERIRAERTIQREKARRVRAVLAHRGEARDRRERRRAAEREFARATGVARGLAEEAEVLEAAAAEPRSRLEALRRKDGLLEDKFRVLASDSTRPMAEHLLRHWRKRPKLPRAGHLLLGAILPASDSTSCHGSDILPAETVEFLAALERMNAPPEGLPGRLDSTRWRDLCTLRSLKLETEIKMEICGLEIAEAEQSLSFHRRVAATVRARAARCRETLRELADEVGNVDEDVWLWSTTGQLEMEPRGCLADYRDAVPISRRELTLATGAIADAEERRRSVLRSVGRMEERISREELRHARRRAVAEELRDRLHAVRRVKVTGLLLDEISSATKPRIGSRDRSRARSCPALPAQPISPPTTHRSLARETGRVRGIRREAAIWHRRNLRLLEEIEIEIERGKREAKPVEIVEISEVELRERKMAATARELLLRRKIDENSRDLRDLSARLDLLRLRTYPTLGFRS